MEVTNVRVRTKGGNDKIKAFASVTFDDAFVVHDVKIIQKEQGKLGILMPSRKGTDGKFRDVAHPISSEMRQKIEVAVIKQYEENSAKS